MGIVPDFVGSSRRFFLTVFLACAAALALALAGEYGFGLEPCILCLTERGPFVVAGLIALAMVALPTSPALRRLALALLLAAFAGNALLSGYHVGIEQHWWESAVCGGPAPAAISLQDLQAAANSAGRPSCDTPQWSLFGITLAGYNGLLNVALAAVVALALYRDLRRPR